MGADLDPDVVTRVLGMNPHQWWRPGELKSFTRPDGSTRVFKSRYEDGGWKHFIPKCHENLPLREQLLLWIARLRGLAGGIRSLKACGWEVELDGFAAGSEVLMLSNEELHQLAGLGVDLALTLARGSDRIGVRDEVDRIVGADDGGR